MLQIHTIRENKAAYAAALKKRNIDATADLDALIELDDKRKHAQHEFDTLKSESNALSKEMGMLFQQGKKEEANALREKANQNKARVNELSDQLKTAETDLQELLYKLPNVPHESVPAGNTDEDNEIVYEEGHKPELHEGSVPHWDLIEQYELVDFPMGAKITGAGFPVYTGKGARLQRALINWFLDEAQKAGYKEVIPPLLINEASGIGTGQLPDKEGQMYHVTNDDLYLIPTAEVPITNIYRDVIISEDEFPIKMCGYTPCFRREAGAWGSHVRGLNRLHQFDKVEIVQIEHPDRSYTTLDAMVEHVKQLLRQLELPFRVARLCGGDLGFTSALTYDMEVWSAAQERWLEVSSTSNFETFQANRLKLRYKDAEGKKHLAHTLNGSALALPRIVAALLENNQTPEGIRIPKVLVPYTGFDVIR